MITPDWDNIYNEYSGKVMGYIAARVQRRADAEDLCSEVFEKVFRKMGDYDEGKAAVGTWIYTITRNTVIDYYRKTRPTAELDENLADAPTDRDLRLDVRQAVYRLPEKYRLPVILFYFEDMAVADIARALDIPEGTVISHLHRGRARLREELKDYGI